MNETLTIKLSSELKAALEDLAEQEGLAINNLANQALIDYLLTHRFRNLRARLINQTERPYTDEDIFEIVS
jgi:predicted transcriptional regulator